MEEYMGLPELYKKELKIRKLEEMIASLSCYRVSEDENHEVFLAFVEHKPGSYNESLR